MQNCVPSGHHSRMLTPCKEQYRHESHTIGYVALDCTYAIGLAASKKYIHEGRVMCYVECVVESRLLYSHRIWTLIGRGASKRYTSE